MGETINKLFKVMCSLSILTALVIFHFLSYYKAWHGVRDLEKILIAKAIIIKYNSDMDYRFRLIRNASRMYFKTVSFGENIQIPLLEQKHTSPLFFYLAKTPEYYEPPIQYPLTVARKKLPNNLAESMFLKLYNGNYLTTTGSPISMTLIVTNLEFDDSGDFFIKHLTFIPYFSPNHYLTKRFKVTLTWFNETASEFLNAAKNTRDNEHISPAKDPISYFDRPSLGIHIDGKDQEFRTTDEVAKYVNKKYSIKLKALPEVYLKKKLALASSRSLVIPDVNINIPARFSGYAISFVDFILSIICIGYINKVIKELEKGGHTLMQVVGIEINPLQGDVSVGHSIVIFIFYIMAAISPLVVSVFGYVVADFGSIWQISMEWIILSSWYFSIQIWTGIFRLLSFNKPT